MASKKSVSIFWFRRDLRFMDNTALLHALNSGKKVLPIFVFDTNIFENLDNKQDARVGFIYNQILELKRILENHGSTLRIFYDNPNEAFLKLINEFSINAVFANRDYETYSIARDAAIARMLQKQNIPLFLFKDHVIFEGKEILKQDGNPFKVFTPFKKVWLAKFHTIGELKTDESVDFSKFIEANPASEPSLESMGFKPNNMPIPSASIPISIIKEYNKYRNFPALNGTSRLGIHLRFGTLSIREIAMMANKYNEVWLDELIWREFYSSILQHFPHVESHAFHKKYELIPWKNDISEFEKWCKGLTGYPLVDAGMRELNQTGFMHNRVRMVTASFLTKHLLIDWRWGELYFASKLLDYDLASNNGGWQWAAGTGTDAQPYFRIFNPESQADKFDPESKYIKQWIPEFGTNNYPNPVVDHKHARIRAIETYKSVVSK